ncbi:pyridoxamine 5'-phosphate oxidase family protein [Peribacillus sp. SCS-37]|uniref:pyridoxamine 5'-phosphate oxidase family protein n=1 Tax=Paraperibacillus esterisolvens TaxID=3115296 RepID=UPI003905D2D6
MPNLVETELIPSLFEFLQKEQLAVLSTIDHEGGGPNVNLISWILARDEKTIVFAAASRSRIIQNIRHHERAVLVLFAEESAFSINGQVMIKNERIKDVPLALTILEMSVYEVRDIMFYGSKISHNPEYSKMYDEEAACLLDRHVMEALTKS